MASAPARRAAHPGGEHVSAERQDAPEHDAEQHQREQDDERILRRLEETAYQPVPELTSFESQPGQ